MAALAAPEGRPRRCGLASPEEASAASERAMKRAWCGPPCHLGRGRQELVFHLPACMEPCI